MLVGTTCEPINGYYETNEAIAARCPDLNCRECDSQNINTCISCFDGHYEKNGQCE